MLTAISLAVGGLLLLAACVLSLPVAVLCVQALGYLFRRAPTSSAHHQCTAPTVAVLMPAHNEAEGIARVVEALMPQLSPADRLLVVADNCSDDTAAIALAAGAVVIQRNDPMQRGKGYALDRGVRELAANAPEVVIIIDADCELAPGALSLLAQACVDTGRPVQASYLMELPEAPSTGLRIAAFAWLVKARLRAQGSHRLGLPCQLMGTGMALPWPVLRRAPLASGNIVEDLQLGVDLALAGSPPLLCAEAVVRSWFPSSVDAANSQRTRWEHGHIATLTSQVPRLVVAACRQRRPVLLAIAAELAVPPLSLLLLLQSMVLVACTVVWLATGLGAGLMVSAMNTGLILVTLTIAWCSFGRSVISLRQLAGVPLYVLAKVPMYLRALGSKRQASWVRTGRGPPKS